MRSSCPCAAICCSCSSILILRERAPACKIKGRDKSNKRSVQIQQTLGVSGTHPLRVSAYHAERQLHAPEASEWREALLGRTGAEAPPAANRPRPETVWGPSPLLALINDGGQLNRYKESHLLNSSTNRRRSCDSCSTSWPTAALPPMGNEPNEGASRGSSPSPSI